MRAVIGIDAAWTPKEPSGVALVIQKDKGWHLGAVCPSYRHFQALADGDEIKNLRPTASIPDAQTLLRSAAVIGGVSIELVAIDMPLSNSPIVGRRASDNAISKAYGRRWCSTHTPNPTRPGPISDDLREDFEQAGYPLQTASISPPGVIEVYPHPALVELAGAEVRLPYKCDKVRNYWPDASREGRRELLYGQWRKIIGLLDRQIEGVAASLPEPSSDARRVDLKAFEDMLDAVVCAWVAVCALDRRAQPFGDENSAIWVPTN